MRPQKSISYQETTVSRAVRTLPGTTARRAVRRYSPEWVLLKFQKTPRKLLVVGTVLVKFKPSFHNFIELGHQRYCFLDLESVPKFSEQLFICNTSGQLFLNLRTILIVPTPSYPTCVREHGGGAWRNNQS